jgi:hypothetical protein
MIDKYIFTKECLEVFIQEALTTKPPTYATVWTNNTFSLLNMLTPAMFTGIQAGQGAS